VHEWESSSWRRSALLRCGVWSGVEWCCNLPNYLSFTPHSFTLSLLHSSWVLLRVIMYFISVTIFSTVYIMSCMCVEYCIALAIIVQCCQLSHSMLMMWFFCVFQIKFRKFSVLFIFALIAISTAWSCRNWWCLLQHQFCRWMTSMPQSFSFEKCLDSLECEMSGTRCLSCM
jgi:hypothetical protein